MSGRRETPPELVRYGPPYGPELLPGLTKEELEAISDRNLYLDMLKRHVALQDKHDKLAEAIKGAEQRLGAALLELVLAHDHDPLLMEVFAVQIELREALNNE